MRIAPVKHKTAQQSCGYGFLDESKEKGGNVVKRRLCRGVTVPQREGNTANSAKAKGIDRLFFIRCCIRLQD